VKVSATVQRKLIFNEISIEAVYDWLLSFAKRLAVRVALPKG